MKNEQVFLIAKGKISGTYADGFHRITASGKTGYYLDRDPTPEEKELMLTDIARHREIIMLELVGLYAAEKALTNKV